MVLEFGVVSVRKGYWENVTSYLFGYCAFMTEV